jgi:DNA-binding transcriptional MerR regulator
MSKLFYTIGETAEILGENVSLVRYWSGYFEKFLKTSRTARGDRRFMPEDVETFKQIHFLVKEKGLTLDGTAKQLDADRASVDKRVRALESLKSIRGQLAEIRKSL